jgi:hypothetical protein
VSVSCGHLCRRASDNSPIRSIAIAVLSHPSWLRIGDLVERSKEIRGVQGAWNGSLHCAELRGANHRSFCLVFSARNPYHHIVDLLYTIVAAVFLTSLLLAGKRLDNLFGMSALAFIGGISYSLYLFHVLCLNIVESLSSQPLAAMPVWLHATINVFLTIVLAALVAWLLSITIERPLARIGRLLSGALLRSRRGNHIPDVGTASTSRQSGGK